MRFPLNKSARLTEDPESFRSVVLREATEIPLPGHPGGFGTVRRHHIHEGVDLYAEDGDAVFAMEAGTVVAYGPFTGPAAGYPWWRDTEFVMVEGSSGVVCYGEIRRHPALALGQSVREGDCLGYVAQVLGEDKGRPRSMLHVEYYVPGTRASCGIWPLNTPRPEGLLDPTPLLRRSVDL